MKFRVMDNLIVLRSPMKIYRTPKTLTWGLTNLCADNKFVVFLDYDNVEYNVCKEDVKMLQNDFNIGTVITRVSSIKNYREDEIGNYHVIGFTKFYFDEIKKLIAKTRCDDRFKRGYIFQQRCWVLRLSEKIDENGEIKKPFTLLREVIPQKHNGRQRQGYNALVELFESIDKIKLKKYFARLDKSKRVEFIRFGAGN